MEKSPQIYAPAEETGRLHQGEIVSNLVQAHINAANLSSPDVIEVLAKRHPIAIVMAQDCDLESDFKRRDDGGPGRELPNILFCEVGHADAMRKARGVTSRAWELFRANKHERFHYLRELKKTDDLQGEGLPVLGIDFRRYFTVPTDEVYLRLHGEAKRRSRLESPYREHLATRFCYFQLRVGLPEDHYVKGGAH